MKTLSQGEKIFRTITLAITGLLLTLFPVWGILYYRVGEIITPFFIVSYFFLPPIGLIGIYFLLKMPGPIYFRSIVAVIALGAFMSFTFVFISMGFHKFQLSYFGDEALEQYEEAKTEVSYLLSPENLGEPNEIEYFLYEEMSMIFFQPRADYLICQYNEEEYLQQKALIEEFFEFQNSPAEYNKLDCISILIDSYLFRATTLPDDIAEDHLDEEMAFIAFNDETREIVYLTVKDVDQRDADHSPEEVLTEDFGWKYVR